MAHRLDQRAVVALRRIASHTKGNPSRQAHRFEIRAIALLDRGAQSLSQFGNLGTCVETRLDGVLELFQR